MRPPEPFKERNAIRQPPKERDAAPSEEEPPLSRSAGRAWPFDPVFTMLGLVVLLAVLIILATLIFPGFVPMSLASADAQPTLTWTLPPTVTNTPTMTPPPTTPTRTPFPTASPTAFINVKAQKITEAWPYGWFEKFADEDEETRNLCTHVDVMFCDYGVSASNMGLYTGPKLDSYPRRFVVVLRFYGFARWWYELEDGKGVMFAIDSDNLPFTTAQLDGGICVPAFWNIEAPLARRLNGRIGYQIRRALLGEAGVSELPEEISKVPTALQLEIFDKPSEGCTVVIPNGFPAKHLPEYLRSEQ